MMTTATTIVPIQTSVIKLLAESALTKGITLLGGVSGVGKTTTIHAVLQYIKDHDLISEGHVLYIDTLAAAADGTIITDIASDFLIGLPAGSQALIVLDELYYEDSVELALMLSQSGKCVLGVAQAYPAAASPVSTEAGMSSVLHNAVMRGQDTFRNIAAHALFNNLNLVAIQDSLAPNHHRSLKITSDIREAVLATVIPENLTLAGYDVMQVAVSQESVDTIYAAIDNLAVERH